MSDDGFFGNMPYLATMPKCQLYVRSTGLNGGTTFRDWGPNRYSLTGSSGAVNSTTQYNFSPCSINTPASSDYLVSVGNYGPFTDYTAPMTISAWIFLPTVTGSYQYILESAHSTYANGDFLFSIYNGGLRFARWTGSGNNVYFAIAGGTPGTISANVWHHVSVQYISTSSCIFELDGSTNTQTPSANTYNDSGRASYGITVGSGDSHTLGLQGYIDEVALFNGSYPYSLFYPKTRRLIVG